MAGVVLATTMWEGVAPEIGRAREEELKTKFWSSMMSRGSRVVRQDKGAVSARAILESIMALRQHMMLDIQTEMAANIDFNKTGAARALQAEMSLQMEMYRKEIQNLSRQLIEAKRAGEMVWKELAKEREEQYKSMQRLVEEREKLNVTAQQLREQELAREREAHQRDLRHVTEMAELRAQLDAEKIASRSPISHTVRWFFRLFK